MALSSYGSLSAAYRSIVTLRRTNVFARKALTLQRVGVIAATAAVQN